MNTNKFYGSKQDQSEGGSKWQRTLKNLHQLALHGPRSFCIWKIFSKQEKAFEYQSKSPLPLVIFSFEVIAISHSLMPPL